MSPAGTSICRSLVVPQYHRHPGVHDRYQTHQFMLHRSDLAALANQSQHSNKSLNIYHGLHEFCGGHVFCQTTAHHFLLLPHSTCGWSAEWALLKQRMRKQDAVTNKYPIKRLHTLYSSPLHRVLMDLRMLNNCSFHKMFFHWPTRIPTSPSFIQSGPRNCSILKCED